MYAVIIVLCTFTYIVRPIAHQHGLIRCRFYKDRPQAGFQLIRPIDQFLTNRLHKFVKSTALRQLFLNDIMHNRCQANRSDIGNIHSHARNDKFPAGSHRIIPGILKLISQPGQSGDDNIVIRVLRETQPLPGQFCTAPIQGKRGVFIYP